MINYRMNLARRLRAHAAIEDKEHAVDLNQAANEIEDFEKFEKLESDLFYLRVSRHLKNAMNDFFEREVGEEPYMSQSIRTEGGNSFIITFKTRDLMDISLRVEVKRYSGVKSG